MIKRAQETHERWMVQFKSLGVLKVKEERKKKNSTEGDYDFSMNALFLCVLFKKRKREGGKTMRNRPTTGRPRNYYI